MFLGLRSLIYPVDDVARAKTWYTAVLGFEPYYDEPPYIGYLVGGYELGLLAKEAAGDSWTGPRTYWGVAKAEPALSHLLDHGATLEAEVHDVGGGIRMASVRDPDGHIFGIIENPEFELVPVQTAGPGPGR